MARTQSSPRSVAEEQQAVTWRPVRRLNHVNLTGLESQQAERQILQFERKPTSSVAMEDLQQLADFCRMPVHRTASWLLYPNEVGNQHKANAIEATGELPCFLEGIFGVAAREIDPTHLDSSTAPLFSA